MEMEMSLSLHTLAMTSIFDTDEGMERLAKAMLEIDKESNAGKTAIGERADGASADGMRYGRGFAGRNNRGNATRQSWKNCGRFSLGVSTWNSSCCTRGTDFGRSIGTGFLYAEKTASISSALLQKMDGFVCVFRNDVTFFGSNLKHDIFCDRIRTGMS